MQLTEVAPRRDRGSWRGIARELGAFGAVGAACFVLDVALFQVLYAGVGFGAVTAKLTSTLVSMTAAFLGHRYWSFGHRPRTDARRQYLRFTLINGLTLLLGVGLVGFVRYSLGQESTLVLQAANITGIALGTAIRYLGYRWWVFPALREGTG